MDIFTAATRTVDPPRRRPPPLACDSHFHVFGELARFPQPDQRPGGFRGLAPLENLLRVHSALGIERGVFVQPWSGYHTDHACLLDALRRTSRDRYVGTAIIDETFSDRDLEDLHAAGVRGARLVAAGGAHAGISAAAIGSAVARIRPFGWYVKLHLGPEELEHVYDCLLRLEDVPVVFDHMCRVRGDEGIASPHARRVADLLRKDNVWIILSNGYHFSRRPGDWSDVVEIARAFYAAAPDRCLWGSDWPHMRDHYEGGPGETEIFELLYRYLPDDAAVQRVLVENPARLHGFTPASAP